MSADEWLDRYATLLGVEAPATGEIELLLDLAGVAAHASERMAAPITCWMAALSDRSLAESLALAQELAEDIGPDVPRS